MKKPVVFITIIILVIIVLSVVQVVVSNRLSTTGVLISRIEEEIKFYKTQNAIISEELLTKSSFANLHSKASDLGFVEEDSQLVISKSLPLAVRQ